MALKVINVRDLSPVRTVTLVCKDRQWLTLAMTYVAGKSPYWGCLWSIPRRNVVSIREIEVVPEKPKTEKKPGQAPAFQSQQM